MPSLIDSFNKIRRSTHCPYARSAKIIFAPQWIDENNLEANLFHTLKPLTELTDSLQNTPWDGYAIMMKGDKEQTLNDLAILTYRTLNFYSENDPKKQYCMRKNLLDHSWQFSFNDTRLFVITFSPCYSKYHSRFTFGENINIILLQPEHSFNDKNIPRGVNPKRIRQAIRKQFSLHHQKYDWEELDNQVEAYRYVKPLNYASDPIAWWKYLDILAR